MWRKACSIWGRAGNAILLSLWPSENWTVTNIFNVADPERKSKETRVLLFSRTFLSARPLPKKTQKCRTEMETECKYGLWFDGLITNNLIERSNGMIYEQLFDSWNSFFLWDLFHVGRFLKAMKLTWQARLSQHSENIDLTVKQIDTAHGGVSLELCLAVLVNRHTSLLNWLIYKKCLILQNPTFLVCHNVLISKTIKKTMTFLWLCNHLLCRMSCLLNPHLIMLTQHMALIEGVHVGSSSYSESFKQFREQCMQASMWIYINQQGIVVQIRLSLSISVNSRKRIALGENTKFFI